MNKRGEERIFTLWWFVAIAAISAAIVLATMGFFSKEVNTREYEAGIMYERILECLVQNGNLRSDFNGSFDIYKECDLSKDVFLNRSLFYFEIVLDGESVLDGGDRSKKADCELKEKVKTENFPGCINQTELILYSKDGKTEKGQINILTVSSQDSLAFVGGENE